MTIIKSGKPTNDVRINLDLARCYRPGCGQRLKGSATRYPICFKFNGEEDAVWWYDSELQRDRALITIDEIANAK